MTDDQLYHEYLAGNQTAGDELMLRYGDALTEYLDAFIHNTHDAEDLMLDCFTVILVDKPRIADGHFRAYLFKTARNKANRLWKIRLNRQEFSIDETLEDTVPDQSASPEEEVIKSEQSTVLNRCLNRIAPQYREALWLVYITQLSYAGAASVLGCTVKRVENLLNNGKVRLREELKKEGITHADV
jgi:RNA polymerase sigma-70 factor (ECF subfamily)